MAEAVKVIVRKRPMNQREKDLKTKDVVAVFEREGRVELTDPAEPKKAAKVKIEERTWKATWMAMRHLLRKKKIEGWGRGKPGELRLGKIAS